MCYNFCNMSATIEKPATKAKREPRNLSLHIPDEEKAELKRLATESGMTLGDYVKAVVIEAIQNEDVFEMVRRKRMRQSSAD